MSLLRLFRPRLQQQRCERHVPVPVTGKLQRHRLAQVQSTTRRRHSEHPRWHMSAGNWRKRLHLTGGGGRRRGGISGAGGWDGCRRDRPSTGSGYDGGLRLSEQPLDGLAVGAVPEFTGELEDSGGAERRHADSAASAVHLCMTIPRWRRGGFPRRGGQFSFGRIAAGCCGSGGGGEGVWIRVLRWREFMEIHFRTHYQTYTDKRLMIWKEGVLGFESKKDRTLGFLPREGNSLIDEKEREKARYEVSVWGFYRPHEEHTPLYIRWASVGPMCPCESESSTSSRWVGFWEIDNWDRGWASLLSPPSSPSKIPFLSTPQIFGFYKKQCY